MKIKLHLKTVQLFSAVLLFCLFQATTISAQQVISEWRSAASGTFANATGTVWEKLVLGTWTLQAAATKPSGSSNVTIRAGHTVTLDASPTTISILNLTIEAGATLNSALTSPAGIGLRMGASSSTDVTAGYTNNVVTLTNNGTFGSTTGTGDGINLEVSTNCASLTVSGTGTTRIARFRPLPANPNIPTTITFNHNVDLMINNNYAFTATQNGASNLATENIIVNISSGKTVKIVNVGGTFHGSVSSTTPQSNPSGTYTYNISGTLDLSSMASGGLQTSTAGSPSLNLNIKNGGLMKLGTSFAAYKGGNNGSINMTIESGGIVDGTLLTSGVANNSSTLGTGNSWFVTQGTGALKLPVSSTSMTFAVGPNANSYNPVTLNNGGGQVFAVSVADVNSPAGIPDVTKAVSRTWSIVPASLPATADITFGYNTGDGNANCVLTDPMQLQNFGTTAWTLLGTATPTVPSSGNTGFQVGYSGISAFGAFNLVSVPTIPVELVSFTGKKNNKVNELTWTTASELNNKGYQIERNQGMEDNWQAIGFVGAKGKAAAYSFQDADVATTSTFYYRLRQMDLDGKETVSKVIAISDNVKTKLKAYPSVTTGLLTIDAEENSTFQVVNLLGQTILAGKITQRLDVSALPQGTYILKVGSEQTKFIKR